MKVRELIEKLNNLPMDAEIQISVPVNDRHPFDNGRKWYAVDSIEDNTGDLEHRLIFCNVVTME